MVAGLGCSSRYWVRLGPLLAKQVDVLAPDLPGFGYTPKPPNVPWPGGPHVREQADQLLAWMDALGIGSAMLCGHSVGCQVTANVAARFPQRVGKLILAAPTFERGQRTLWSHIPRLLLDALVESPSLTPLMIGQYFRSNPVRVIQQALRAMSDPIEVDLPNVTAPTLVLRGRLDPLVRQPWTDYVTSLLPHGTQVVIDHVGHAVQYSAPAATAEAVLAFLAKATY